MRTTLRYHIILFLGYVAALLPLGMLYVIADCLYPVVYYLVRYRRRVVRSNLLSSFPEKTPKEIRSVEHEYYHFFCDYMAETVKLLHISHDEMCRRMTFTGFDAINEVLDREHKTLCFVFLGHYCNWEWVASLGYWAPSDMRCAQIYHPLYDKAFDRLFLSIRSQFGGENIPMKQTLRRVVEMKREGTKVIIGFISDQLPKWNSIHHFTPFLNHETAVFTGMEQMAKKLDALVCYADVRRLRRGYYTCDFRIMTDTPSAVPDFDLTDQYMQHLEAMIRRDEGLWLWSHKRWRRTKEQWEERERLKRQNAQNADGPELADSPTGAE